MHQYGREDTITGSAINASVRPDVHVSMEECGWIDASVWREQYNHGQRG